MVQVNRPFSKIVVNNNLSAVYTPEAVLESMRFFGSVDLTSRLKNYTFVDFLPDTFEEFSETLYRLSNKPLPVNIKLFHELRKEVLQDAYVYFSKVKKVKLLEYDENDYLILKIKSYGRQNSFLF